MSDAIIFPGDPLASVLANSPDQGEGPDTQCHCCDEPDAATVCHVCMRPTCWRCVKEHPNDPARDVCRSCACDLE